MNVQEVWEIAKSNGQNITHATATSLQAPPLKYPFVYYHSWHKLIHLIDEVEEALNQVKTAVPRSTWKYHT